MNPTTRSAGTFVTAVLFLILLALPTDAQPVALQAGHVFDTESGAMLPDRIILIENGRITAVGTQVAIPENATVIDLKDSWVVPGLIDAHTHMLLTRQPARDYGNYYFTTLLETTSYRSVVGVANAQAMLEAGFTAIRDLGNTGNYGDMDLRRAINEGWVPGPMMQAAGRIVAPYGGQFTLQAERRDLAEPEYFFADTEEQIRMAVRENIHFGADVVKLIVDDQRYDYTQAEIRAAVEEAAKAGVPISAHAYTDKPATDAILAGVASLEHATYLSDNVLQLMKERNVYLVGTDFPEKYSPSSYDARIDRLRRAYAIGTPIAFGTDASHYREGFTRGDLTFDFMHSFVDAGIPPTDILRMMTVNAARLMEIDEDHGTIGVGMVADIVALSENPLDDIEALRGAHFVMKEGQVFKQDGRFLWSAPTVIGE